MEVEAKTNGACLASFFEMIACAPNDLEGLVIGVQPQVTKSTLVTDTEIAKEKVVCVHNITRFYVCPSAGSLSETKSLYLRETKKADETVIGWLKFRRNTPLIPSAKEQSVNNAFVREHLTTQGFPPLFVLFTESVNESEGHWIRGVKYKAFSSVPEHNAVLSLEGVPLDVSNVEATSGKEYGEFKAHNNIKLPQQTLDATRLSVSSLERYMDTLTEEARRLAEEIYKTEEVIRLGKK